MSHNLAKRADGQGMSFFGVLTGGWHKLGRVYVSDAADVPDDAGESVVVGKVETAAQAMEASGANFNVTTRQAAYATEDGRDYIDMPLGYRAIIREDNGAFLGTCKERYYTIQNVIMFNLLQVLVTAGLATWETGGVLGVGERVFSTVKWCLPEHLAAMMETSGLQPFACATWSHDGTTAATLFETVIRIVCQNTLMMGLAASANMFKIKHTQTAEVRLTDAAMKLWGKVLAHYEQATADFKMLRAVALDVQTFNKLVLDTVIPLPTLADKATDRAKKVHDTLMAKAEDRRAVITSLWHDGTGHTGDSSAWEAWQGAIQAIDHNDIMPLRSSDVVTANLWGTHGDAKAEVFSRLLAHCEKVNK